MSHLPDTKSIISNLVQEYAYVTLRLDYGYLILFCVSSKPIEFSKQEEIIDTKPLAGYTIDEIKDYLSYAEYEESRAPS